MMNIDSVITTKILIVLFALNINITHAQHKEDLKSLKYEFSKMSLPEVQLDFENILNPQLNHEDLDKQLLHIKQILLSSEALETKNYCELVEYEKIRFDLKTHQVRLELLQHRAHNIKPYIGSIYPLNDAKKWYQLLTLWWLGEDISPVELKSIGEQEFQLAHKQLTLIEKSEKDKKISSANSQSIRNAYQQTEVTLKQHLYKIFPKQWSFKPVNIERSNLGSSFSVPGFYNLESETFFYNPLEEDYNLSQVDWLYIHEAVPGHHYQNKMVEKYGICNQQLSTGSEMAFTEGWAAYTETLGKELGLFQDPNSYYFALKWQALRAMRVIIDVGIHAQGWSVSQAESYWLKHFPEGKDVMHREIERIQKWPMQVNTYVFGKYKIEQLKAQLKKQQGDMFNEVIFHKNIVSLSQLPLSSINYYTQIFTNKKPGATNEK